MRRWASSTPDAILDGKHADEDGEHAQIAATRRHSGGDFEGKGEAGDVGDYPKGAAF